MDNSLEQRRGENPLQFIREIDALNQRCQGTDDQIKKLIKDLEEADQPLLDIISHCDDKYKIFGRELPITKIDNGISHKDILDLTFTVSCELESLEEAGGLFEPDGYKYKVVSHALVAFGEWMSGYDILGYTNDDSFVELSFPRKVVMEVTLQSGSPSRFEFRDCKLLAW